MNKQLALDILGLPCDATRADAKSAFRGLAKACHPDRYAGDPIKVKAFEEKMKQVNAAFSFLLPLLPVVDITNAFSPQPCNHSVPPNSGKSNRAEQKRSGLFSRFAAGWKKRVLRKEHTKIFASDRGRAVKKAACFSRAAGVKPGKMPNPGSGFDAVLNHACESAGAARLFSCLPGRSASVSCRNLKHSVSGSWRRPMPLKAGQSKSCGPVEAIRPVSPVSRVKKIF